MVQELIVKVGITSNGTIYCDNRLIGSVTHMDEDVFNWLKKYDVTNEVIEGAYKEALQKSQMELADAYMEISRLKDIHNNPEVKEIISKVSELLVERDELQGGIIKMARLLGRR